jgi:polysaccharide export outer membrane protein
MTPNRRIRARVWRCAALILTLGACAERRPELQIPGAQVAPRLSWHIEDGDVIKTRVYKNPDLSGESTVGIDGTAFFQGLGRVRVIGMVLDSVETMLNTRYAQFLKEPAVQVTMQRDLTLYGAVRGPGVYSAEPTMTMQGLLARAGGASNNTGTIQILLERSDGTVVTLPREARLGTLTIHRTDAIRLSEESFFVRNATAIQATQIVITSLSAVIGLVSLLTR